MCDAEHLSHRFSLPNVRVTKRGVVNAERNEPHAISRFGASERRTLDMGVNLWGASPPTSVTLPVRHYMAAMMEGQPEAEMKSIRFAVAPVLVPLSSEQVIHSHVDALGGSCARPHDLFYGQPRGGSRKSPVNFAPEAHCVDQTEQHPADLCRSNHRFVVTMEVFRDC